MRTWKTGFVMPYIHDRPSAADYLAQAIDSVFRQTNDNWILAIVDDGSRSLEADELLGAFVRRDPSRIFVKKLLNNVGAGVARNEGIQLVASHGADIVSFLDSDDIAHPTRCQISNDIFRRLARVDFMYSSFEVIDESSQTRPYEELTPSIQEILDCHRDGPPVGSLSWIDIGVRTGYATLTSTVSVRTPIALQCQFPDERVSEDQHAWFRYAATGDLLYYCPTALCKYRIPRDTAGSSCRNKIGADRWHREKSRVDTEGFIAAGAIAIQKGEILPDDFAHYLSRFHRRMSQTFRAEGYEDIARNHMSMAMQRTWNVEAAA